MEAAYQGVEPCGGRGAPKPPHFQQAHKAVDCVWEAGMASIPLPWWPALASGAGLPVLACQLSLCKWRDFLLFNFTGHAQASSCFP